MGELGAQLSRETMRLLLLALALNLALGLIRLLQKLELVAGEHVATGHELVLLGENLVLLSLSLLLGQGLVLRLASALALVLVLAG